MLPAAGLPLGRAMARPRRGASRPRLGPRAWLRPGWYEPPYPPAPQCQPAVRFGAPARLLRPQLDLPVWLAAGGDADLEARRYGLPSSRSALGPAVRGSGLQSGRLPAIHEVAACTGRRAPMVRARPAPDIRRGGRSPPARPHRSAGRDFLSLAAPVPGRRRCGGRPWSSHSPRPVIVGMQPGHRTSRSAQARDPSRGHESVLRQSRGSFTMVHR
jgi:hypothetical protein